MRMTEFLLNDVPFKLVCVCKRFQSDYYTPTGRYYIARGPPATLRHAVLYQLAVQTSRDCVDSDTAKYFTEPLVQAMLRCVRDDGFVNDTALRFLLPLLLEASRPFPDGDEHHPLRSNTSWHWLCVKADFAFLRWAFGAKFFDVLRFPPDSVFCLDLTTAQRLSLGDGRALIRACFLAVCVPSLSNKDRYDAADRILIYTSVCSTSLWWGGTYSRRRRNGLSALCEAATFAYDQGLLTHTSAIYFVYVMHGWHLDIYSVYDPDDFTFIQTALDSYWNRTSFNEYVADDTGMGLLLSCIRLLSSDCWPALKARCWRAVMCPDFNKDTGPIAKALLHTDTRSRYHAYIQEQLFAILSQKDESYDSLHFYCFTAKGKRDYWLPRYLNFFSGCSILSTVIFRAWNALHDFKADESTYPPPHLTDRVYAKLALYAIRDDHTLEEFSKWRILVLPRDDHVESVKRTKLKPTHSDIRPELLSSLINDCIEADPRSSGVRATSYAHRFIYLTELLPWLKEAIYRSESTLEQWTKLISLPSRAPDATIHRTNDKKRKRSRVTSAATEDDDDDDDEAALLEDDTPSRPAKLVKHVEISDSDDDDEIV